MSAEKPKTPENKAQVLRTRGCLNPRPQSVEDPLFVDSEFFDARDAVQVKYEMLRGVRVDGRSISECASSFGFSRPAFYQAQAAFEQAGVVGLLPRKPGPRGAHKLDDDVMAYVAEQLASDQTLGAGELAKLIAARFARKVHPRSIERALVRQRQRGKKKPR